MAKSEPEVNIPQIEIDSLAKLLLHKIQQYFEGRVGSQSEQAEGDNDVVELKQQ